MLPSYLLLLVLPSLLAANTPPLPALDINWATFVPKYINCNTSCHLTFPFCSTLWDQSRASLHPGASRLLVRVRDCWAKDPTASASLLQGKGDAATHHLWVVPGGPGGHSNAIEYRLDYLDQYIPRGVWIYAMDHRGTGKSSK